MPTFLSATSAVPAAFAAVSAASLAASVAASLAAAVSLAASVGAAVLAYEGIQYQYLAPGIFSDTQWNYPHEHAFHRRN